MDQETGEGLPGVTIMVRGTSNGTITDGEGYYSLQARNESDLLVFSFVGYKDQEQPIKGKTTVNVEMVTDVSELEEVVVVGYGTQKKSDLTGAVAQVSSKDLEAMPVQNALQGIQGKAPGVDISSNARPGEVGVIRVRGDRSISGGNSPLYVVDGVPLQSGGLEAFNPNDIESITVLKDASASAIYGSRASNGVVIVTTKRGVQGKAQINYDGALTFEQILDLAPNFNAPEYAAYRRDALRTENLYSTAYPNPEDDYTYFSQDPVAWESIAAGYNWADKTSLTPVMRQATAAEQALYGVNEIPDYDPGKVPTTHWTDYVKRTGVTQNHNVSVRMGSDKVSTYISGGYLNQTGTNKGQDYNRYTGLIKMDVAPTEWLKFGGTINASYSVQNYGYAAGGSRGSRTIYEAAKGQLPFAKPYDDQGNYIFNPGGNINIINPLRDIHTVIDERTTIRTFGSFYGEARLMKGLRLKTIFGPDIRNYRDGQFQSAESSLRGGGSSSSTNYARLSQTQALSWTWENLLYYDRSFGQHHLGLTLLESSSLSRSEGSDMSAQNLPYDSQLWYNLGSTNDGALLGWSSSYSRRTLLSYMARMQYEYGNKYLLTASARVDGASVLAAGHKWDFFPSMALGWKIDEEAFLNDISWLDQLKLRFGLGTTGNQSVSPYSTAGGLVRIPYEFGSDPASGYVTSDPKGSTQGSLPNKDLGWEKTAQWNYGVDFGFFRGRVMGSLDYFVANTFDILLDKTPVSVTGYTSITVNAGKTQNKGVEIYLSTVNVETKNFQWTTMLSFTKIKSQIISLADGKEDDITNLRFIGKPISVYYDYKKIGIWQTSDQELIDAYNANGATYTPGDIRVEDVNKDNKIDLENDRQIIGHANPNWTGGLTNTFSYRNVELSIFVFSRWGQTVEGGAVDMSGQFASRRINYWTPENPTNKYPKADYLNGGQPIHYSSMNYRDGSFVKVRYITLGYQLPGNLLGKVRVSQMKVYAQLLNPFHYSKTKFLDPDSSYQNSGTNNSASPITTRSLVVGLHLTF